MAFTLKIALFKICDVCGTHGHIVYPDGTKSKECATKRQARELVKVLIGLNIDEAEAKALIEMINATDLIEANEIVEKFCDNRTEIIEGILAKCGRKH